MKKLIFLFLFSLFLGSANSNFDILNISEKIREFYLLEIAESSGNSKAVSKRHAYGKHQITWIALKDYNKRHNKKYQLHEMFLPELSAYVAWDYLEVSRKYFYSLKDDPIYFPCIYSSYNLGREGTIRKWKGREVYRIYLRYIDKILSKEKMDNFRNKYVWVHSETDKIKYFIKKKDILNGLYRL